MPIQSELRSTSHMSTHCYNVCVFLIGNGVIRIRPPLCHCHTSMPPLPLHQVLFHCVSNSLSLKPRLGDACPGCLLRRCLPGAFCNYSAASQQQQAASSMCSPSVSIVDDSWPLVVVVVVLAVARHKDLSHN